MSEGRETRIYKITGFPRDLERLERFFAMLHYSSLWGHSGTFAMTLDGDGLQRLVVSPEPKQFRTEYNLAMTVGGDVEVAVDKGYALRMSKSKTVWTVQPSVTLYKDGKAHKTEPHNLEE